MPLEKVFINIDDVFDGVAIFTVIDANNPETLGKICNATKTVLRKGNEALVLGNNIRVYFKIIKTFICKRRVIDHFFQYYCNTRSRWNLNSSTNNGRGQKKCLSYPLSSTVMCLFITWERLSKRNQNFRLTIRKVFTQNRHEKKSMHEARTKSVCIYHQL